MLALINPAVLPALRIAAMFFLIINLLGGMYIFHNRQRFSVKIQIDRRTLSPVGKLRVEVVLIPWCVLTLFPLILLIYLWIE
jgi:hypothetical protein